MHSAGHEDLTNRSIEYGATKLSQNKVAIIIFAFNPTCEDQALHLTRQLGKLDLISNVNGKPRRPTTKHCYFLSGRISQRDGLIAA